MPNKQTYSVQGVEIFSAGTWNGDEYTIDDLNEMVIAFDETSEGVRPYIKLGHDENQNLLQEDGLPSAGWINKLYVLGDKLVADITDIPKKIFELIESKAYRKVSSEIYWNLKVGEKLYKKFLGAVALLGSDMPGCMNLSDILGRYTKMTSEPPKVYSNSKNLFEINQKQFTIEKERDQMPTDKELQLEAEVKTFKAQTEAQAVELANAKAEAEELKKFKLDQEAITAKALADVKVAQDQSFIGELEKENLCSPAMKPFIVALLGEEKKEYSVKVGTEDKKLNKKDLLKETLKLFKAIADVNLDESSKAGVREGKADQKAFDEKVAKFMNENKGSTYSQAVKAVMKDQSQ